jgi:hypothetical protein
MNRRRVLLLLLGLSVGLHAYFVLPGLWRRWLLPPEQEERAQIAATASAAGNHLAPVLWWGQMPASERDNWRARKPIRFLLVGGQAQVDGTVLPTGRIKAYLDEKVRLAEIDHVVVAPGPNTKWGDLLPVLDECRKSRVQAVLLNPTES